MEQREGGTNLSSSSVVTESNSPARSAGKAKVEQPSPLLADGTSFVTASILCEGVRASVPHSGLPQPSSVINGCNRLKRILASLGEPVEKVREVVPAKSNQLVGEGAKL